MTTTHIPRMHHYSYTPWNILSVVHLLQVELGVAAIARRVAGRVAPALRVHVAPARHKREAEILLSSSAPACQIDDEAE